MTTTRSAIPEWFQAEETRLVGRVCAACSSVFFPPTISSCRNPACGSDQLETSPLSNRGRVWSWTRNHYKPPAPYVATDPFEPYVVLAVELVEEGMTVLGQLSPDSDPVDVGDAVVLRTEALFEEDGVTQLVWRWTLDGTKDEEGRS